MLEDVKLHTIEGIASDVISKFGSELMDTIKLDTVTNARMLHHLFGRWIRNTYSLWYDNNLTLHWRSNPDGRDMRDGVDYSKDHPDAVSADIITEVWNQLQQGSHQ